MFMTEEDIEEIIEELEEEIIVQQEEIDARKEMLERYRDRLNEMNQLYYVRFVDSGLRYLNKRNRDGHIFISTEEEDECFKTKFTEEEIKKIDPRYWQFAIPVKDDCE